MLTLTETAQAAVQNFIVKSGKPIEGLRITVSSGGCSGFTYGMSLEETAPEGDHVVEFGSDPITKVFVEPESAEKLIGVVIDFVETVEGAGFKFENPNATACSCGKSFC